MKIVTAAQLVDAYYALNPREHRIPEHQDPASARADLERIFNNWLESYLANPQLAISVVKTNWRGKVTTALFNALALKQPKTKTAMLRTLMEVNEI
jgi:hypothetical protein